MPSCSACCHGGLALLLSLSAGAVSAATVGDPTTQPATTAPVGPALQADGGVGNPAFDPTAYLTGDWGGFRGTLAAHGIGLAPQLILDDSQNFQGGLRTGNSFRLRFNLPISIDTGKLFDLPGGQIYSLFSVTHGGDAHTALTGDVQNFDNDLNDPQRANLLQLWYEQHLFDIVRVRVGKQDASTDFDNVPNSSEFLNNAYSTSPTIPLLPSDPETAFGVQVFVEPSNGFYFGAGVFDGSVARGVHTGDYGPSRFWDGENNLFLIAETGLHYKLLVHGHHRPGDLGVGGWWDTNSFEKIDRTGREAGTGGVYFIGDQVLWERPHEAPVAGGENASNTAQPEEEEYPGGIAVCYSVAWADSIVNTVDGNALGGLTWTGMLPRRDIDVAGLGVTAAHLAPSTGTRDRYELTIESFYRIRFTQAISLKPDLQYIIHPDGGSAPPSPVRHNALVGTLRLDVDF